MLTFRFAFLIGFFAIVSCPLHCPAQEAKEAPPKTDKFVTVYGAKIHYVEAGSGAPLILIHGLADNVAVWDSVIPSLAAKFRVIAFDQIGFGHSDKPLLNYRVSTFVDFLDGLMTELKIERASLVGNSLGGWVAAAFALTHPERVERLVLSDAAGYAALAKTMDPRALRALRLASHEDIRYLGPLGADIEPMEKAGVPAFSPIQDSRFYFNYHHTAADTLDKIVPKELAENSLVASVLAYALANMEQPLPR
ncbi:MAG: hypothetical protein DME69_14950 [Verrucomicrobia bacterium]|nr:MAG: hypothetical protein DME69_14950 [Verrucomicrobiota bacterium]